jgi:hypothetical protein
MTDQAAARLPLNGISVSPVPADCSMTGLPYMPLYLDRLQRSKSWARARRNPALAFYMINLWAAAWRGTPAGSLEDDDDILCTAAMCDPLQWNAVRADLMRGWLRCSDGRVYNPTICDVAAGVWETRVEMRASLARARQAKAAKRERVAAQGNLPLRPVVVASTKAPRPSDHIPAESLHIVEDNPANTAESRDLNDSATPDREIKEQVQPEKDKGETPLPPGPTQRGTRLPVGWEPTAESHLFASRLGLNSDDAAEAFTDRSRGTGRRSPDWQAAFRDWCRGAHERRQPRKLAEKPGKLDGYEAYATRRAAEMFAARTQAA